MTRELMGRLPIWSPDMAWLTSASSVLSNGASAVTVMVSVADPTCRLMSMRSVCATCTTTPVCTYRLKPALVTVT